MHAKIKPLMTSELMRQTYTSIV